MNFSGCISFDSYIKPQPRSTTCHYTYVVYLLIPTSNHNCVIHHWKFSPLYIFWFLHQTTTLMQTNNELERLYIFWFLHQTTTVVQIASPASCCISFDSYIKPQRVPKYVFPAIRCISFDSYIKPQLPVLAAEYEIVVYLLIPTSNHNSWLGVCRNIPVVYLLIPTSNHNMKRNAWVMSFVVYLLIPTSNHNLYKVDT